MPAEGIHLTALREAMAHPALDVPVRQRLVRWDDAARFGAILADLPYFDRYAAEVARYALRIPARPSPWGAAIHDGGAVALAEQLLAIAVRDRDEILGAIALGLVSHCAIDRALHPLINALAREHRGGANHDASHREVEKFQSICFHEQYLGRDTMGTPEITGHLAIQRMGLLDERLIGRLREGWSGAMGKAPSVRELRGFARGYRQHVWLLGTAVGKRVAPPAAKEAARPRYLVGAWGSFERLLEEAVARSVHALNVAGAVLDGDAADLAVVLPGGTIDPQGDALDLSRPVRV